jgi:hypothetical protein
MIGLTATEEIGSVDWSPDNAVKRFQADTRKLMMPKYDPQL